MADAESSYVAAIGPAVLDTDTMRLLVAVLYSGRPAVRALIEGVTSAIVARVVVAVHFIVTVGAVDRNDSDVVAVVDRAGFRGQRSYRVLRRDLQEVISDGLLCRHSPGILRCGFEDAISPARSLFEFQFRHDSC